jgi:preprotein translocase subunit SecG
VHTRRIAAFFLGAWLAGSLVMVFISTQDTRSASAVVNAPMPPAEKMIKSLGADQALLLLRHAAAEETRSALFVWESIEILLALILGGCLYLGTQKRVFPIVLCGAMLVLVLFQHFGLAPELAYRGRETDFPPGNALVGPIERLRALQAVYYGAEIVKLVAGGILASYLFVFRSSRRSSRKEVNVIDHADHGHINR